MDHNGDTVHGARSESSTWSFRIVTHYYWARINERGTRTNFKVRSWTNWSCLQNGVSDRFCPNRCHRERTSTRNFRKKKSWKLLGKFIVDILYRIYFVWSRIEKPESPESGREWTFSCTSLIVRNTWNSAYDLEFRNLSLFPKPVSKFF